MKIIGLTGPSGSGKSALCAILAQRGILSVNADNVYHKLLLPPSACIDALAERFGNGILAEDGSVNRAALAKIVFAPGAESELEALNDITLKFVIEKIKHIISGFANGHCPAVIVDAPTLFESGFDKECDLIVTVIANKAIRTDRIMKRDGLSYEKATERINAQKSDDFYTERSDIVIRNNFGKEQLTEQAEEIFKFLEASE